MKLHRNLLLFSSLALNAFLIAFTLGRLSAPQPSGIVSSLPVIRSDDLFSAAELSNDYAAVQPGIEKVKALREDLAAKLRTGNVTQAEVMNNFTQVNAAMQQIQSTLQLQAAGKIATLPDNDRQRFAAHLMETASMPLPASPNGTAAPASGTQNGVQPPLPTQPQNGQLTPSQMPPPNQFSGQLGQPNTQPAAPAPQPQPQPPSSPMPPPQQQQAPQNMPPHMNMQQGQPGGTPPSMPGMQGQNAVTPQGMAPPGQGQGQNGMPGGPQGAGGVPPDGGPIGGNSPTPPGANGAQGGGRGMPPRR